MEESNNRTRQILVTLAVLIVIAVIVGVATVSSSKEDETTTSSQTETTETTTEAAMTDSSTAESATYVDGTYTAEGDYTSPGGSESITISVTLKDGVITDTSAQAGATNGTAEQHQEDFIEAYKELVVGKSIDDVELSRVAGASLTTRGFNNAIQQIQDEAQA